ncbi:MAG: glutamate synthase small subunit [Bryobacterales bacterium]|jgi:glutamate synthase (NADPH/NADH) small chain|nr:glutamate synthase small subunit [Bryobacterales bacterium]
MGKNTGFMEYTRELPERRPVEERVNDWFEIYKEFPLDKVRTQGARCMDCGVPFCHTGCPLNNIIPDWNDLVYRDRWRSAVRVLHSTNNFPEFTGRICPAPCEAACVLGINEPPVTIKVIERTIIDHAFQEGWIQPEPPAIRTGKRVAVVGSGPAGLAAAQQLARAGHWVTVFEKSDRIGGLLRYGIPNFKMEKQGIDRRVEQMGAEGVEFITNSHITSLDDLRSEYQAIVLAMGAEHPRDLPVPGRELKGIHFAMDFLTQQNKRNEGDSEDTSKAILATGKPVIIIGGGDTGADCLGTSHRQKAASVHQFEILPKPPEDRAPATPWPMWPLQLRVESSHEEGGLREWAVATVKFEGDAQGNVKKLHGVRVGAAPKFAPLEGSEFTLDAELVLLAMGFTGPVRPGLIEKAGLNLDQRGNIATENYQSSIPGVFAAGDARRGQSLVVWAIAEGRKAAEAANEYLAKTS